MVSYSISAGSDYVTVRVTGMSTGSVIHFYVRYEPTTGEAVAEEFYMATGTSVSRTLYGLSPNTNYAINVGPIMSNGYSTDWIGTKYFTTLPEEPDRPNDWCWWSAIQSGGNIAISANEWNAFCNRINEFRDYAGLSEYSFTSVQRGTVISAAIVNQARTAISHISGHGILPSQPYSGNTIYASYFIGLQNALNAVP